MMKKKYSRSCPLIQLFAAASVTSCLVTGAIAGSLNGAVRDPGGNPITGAIVTLTDDRGVSELVYTNYDGAFHLATDMEGSLELWIRKRYHRDDLRKLDLAQDANISLEAVLRPLTDLNELSEDHPTLSHFSLIAFDPNETALFSRPNFARDCVSCHSLGEAVTRTKRSLEDWTASVGRMHAYLGNGDPELALARAEMLAKAFDGTPATSNSVVPTDPLLFAAKVYRWRLDGSLVPHDPAVHKGNNRVYTVDMMLGAILETDLKTGETLTHIEPADGMPPGGVFTQMGMPAPYGMKVPRAPHSLAEGKDGKFYMTDLVGNSIAMFDPKTRKFEHHQIDPAARALYPHTIRTDKEGILWFTIAFSNQVGRFDPESGNMKIIPLPDSASLSIVGGPSPYGIDINPKDGSVWYTKLAADRIGRIDPKTLEIKEFDSPVRGPRRQRFDAAGRLWTAGFSEGAIVRIDVDSWNSKIFRLPVFAPDEVPTPYALAIHPGTQEVWVNDTMLDLVWRFLPDEERFIAYPLPIKGTYTREFTFTREGWACTTNNSLNQFIEGGVPELICIDVDTKEAKK